MPKAFVKILPRREAVGWFDECARITITHFSATATAIFS
jgi:hypothetical protein